MSPFLLLFLGLFLILVEFYLPGAIMGIIGSVLVLTSIVLFISQSNSLVMSILFIAGAAVSVILLIRFALWRIVHTKPGYSIYSAGSQEGFQASQYDASAVGKLGTVLTDLKPGGYIIVDGQQHQALSNEGYLSKGEEVLVIGGQEESLIVKSHKKESNS
jgi:membrane-bound serine protease (ClpP class)